MELLQLAIIGLGAGVIGGMFGIGGSIILIPALTEVLGPDQHLYQAAAMIVNFFVVVPAVYQHRRAGAIDRPTIARIVPLATLAVLAGVGVSELRTFSGEGEAYLRGVFGAFLLAAGAHELYRMLRFTGERASETAGAALASVGHAECGWRHVAAVALPTGLIAGLLGIGGGLLAVPLQRRFLRTSLRVAIANSAAVIIVTSLFGACVKNYAYAATHVQPAAPLILAAVLAPTAALGSYCGSRLTHRLQIRAIKSAFMLLLVLGGVRLLYQAALSVPTTEPTGATTAL